MDNPYAPPSARKDNDSLGVDDMQIRRSPPHPAPTTGVFELAWAHVKARPVPTILLAALSTFFGGGRCSPPNLSGISDFNQTGGFDSGGSTGSGYEYGSDIDLSGVFELVTSGDLYTLPGIVGQASSAFETGLIAGMLGLMLVILLVFFVLGVVTQAAEDIYWLRILRGQKDDLGFSFQVGKYLLPIAVAQILVGLGTFAGMILCLVPGVILAVGWSFVGIVAVDKNLGYVDAVKASWRLTDGYKLEIFLLYLISALLVFAGLLLCVGVFVALPVVQGAFAATYVRLAEPGNSYLNPGEPLGVDVEGDDAINQPGTFGGIDPSATDATDPYDAQW